MPLPRIAVAVVVVALLPAPAQASCAAPEITTPRSVTAGEDLVVTGDFFAAECNDTGNGCIQPRRSPPMTGVTVTLAGDFDTPVLAVVDARNDYSLEAVLPVPADTKPGRYDVIVSTEESAGLIDSARVIVREP